MQILNVVYICVLCTTFFISESSNAFFSHCDETKDSFAKYYGVSKDDIDYIVRPTKNKKAKTKVPIYEGANPTTGISGEDSFVLPADRGAGKTTILEHLKTSLIEDKNSIIFEPIESSIDLDSALRYFLWNTSKISDNEDQFKKANVIAKMWGENDMLDFVLSRMAVDMIDKTVNMRKLKKLSLADRQFLLAVTILYDPVSAAVHFAPLKKLIYDLEPKPPADWYNYRDAISNTDSCYKDIKELVKQINVLDQENIDDKIKVLCLVTKEAKINYKNILPMINEQLDRSKILKNYIDILGHAGFHCMYVFDGLDEVDILHITSKNCSNEAFTRIIKSTKPFFDGASGGIFKLFFFIPLCANTNTQEILPLFNRSKVIYKELLWDKKNVLKNYADLYVLNYIRSHANGCALPEKFSDLVGGDMCAAEIFNKIHLPRDFNKFLGYFIDNLNTINSGSGVHTFIGDSNCTTVDEAIKSTLQDKKFENNSYISAQTPN